MVKDALELWGQMGSDVAAVDNDTVSHEVMRFLGIEKVNALPVPMNGREGIGVESSSEDQHRLLVERAEASIEVIAICVDQVQGHDGKTHPGHGGGKFFYSTQGAAKPVSGEDTGSIRMPQKIAVSLEEIFAEIDFDDAIVAHATPVFIKRNFALAGGINHAAGHDEFPISGFFTGEYLIGGENHVLETFNGIDGFDGASALLQNATEILPLTARFHAIDCLRAQHVRIFLIHNIKIIWWTHERGGHSTDGSGAEEAEASKRRRIIGRACRIVGKLADWESTFTSMRR